LGYQKFNDIWYNHKAVNHFENTVNTYLTLGQIANVLRYGWRPLHLEIVKVCGATNSLLTRHLRKYEGGVKIKIVHSEHDDVFK